MQTSFCSASFNKDSFSDKDKDLNETTAFLPFANAWTAYFKAVPSAPIGNMIATVFASVDSNKSDKFDATSRPQKGFPCFAGLSSRNPTVSIPSRLENFSPPPPHPTII